MEPQQQVPILTPGLPKGPTVLFREAWGFYKQNWKTLISISAIPPVMMIVSMVMFRSEQPVLAALGLIVSIVAAVLFMVMQPALIDVMRKIDANPNEIISVKAQYRFGLHYFWSLVLLLIIAVTASLGSFSLFIIPGVILAIYNAFYIYALVLEGKKGMDAFATSYTLVKDRWLGVFGRMAYLLLIYIAVSLVLSGVRYILASALGFVPETSNYETLSTALEQVLAIFVGPLALVYMYRLYESLKATRVGTDEGSYRTWLKAFMAIGVLVMITLPLLAIMYGRLW